MLQSIKSVFSFFSAVPLPPPGEIIARPEPSLPAVGRGKTLRSYYIPGFGMLAVILVAGAGWILLRPASPKREAAPPPVMDAAAAEAKRDVHQAHLIGEQLELSVTDRNNEAVVYAIDGEQLNAALSLVRQRTLNGPTIVSVGALARSVQQALSAYGLDRLMTAQAEAGPRITLRGRVSRALVPLKDLALRDLRALLAGDAVLAPVGLVDQTETDDKIYFWATFLGDRPAVFTSEGLRHPGDLLFGRFELTKVDQEFIHLQLPLPADGPVLITIPIHEPWGSRLTAEVKAKLSNLNVVIVRRPTQANGDIHATGH